MTNYSRFFFAHSTAIDQFLIRAYGLLEQGSGPIFMCITYLTLNATILSYGRNNAVRYLHIRGQRAHLAKYGPLALCQQRRMQ